MPRNQNAGNLALRNRNRVTNKTRLKVIKGNIDADPIVLDEDEERARVVSTAGVDAEDANEHHLQAVLSAASHRATTHAQRTARGASDKLDKKPESTTIIPVPDAAGVVENFADLYPSNQWVSPASYVKFSDVVEECLTNGIADGHTYFMDERDVEWLEKNNQDARGEGTSSLTSGPSGTTTRSGGLSRSAKSRGKDPETHQAVTMDENLFELVMGLFEKITHDNTPFLHVSVQQGNDFPPFSDYQEIFASELPASYFATFIRPTNLPPPSNLVKVARTVYPHWRKRKQERECHRIIPSLNFDESDTKNESYICFRRREIKAIRKTRTAQVSSSDKLIRLKGELLKAFELSKLLLSREALKREVGIQAQAVWERRMAFVDLKRQLPQFGSREDEELLFDKERPPKRPRPSDASLTQPPKWPNNKIRPSGEATSSPAPVEPLLRPKERTLKIMNQIEEQMKRQKERDSHWEDQIDNPYQPLPMPYGERLFKDLCKVQDIQSLPPAARQERSAFLVRSRVGRGGIRRLDRRCASSYSTEREHDILRQIYSIGKQSGEGDQELNERLIRMRERHRYDLDPIALEGSVEEEDRIVLDDFDPRYLRHNMSILHESDHNQLSPDYRIKFSEAVNQIVQSFMRRDSMQAQHRVQSASNSPLQATQTGNNATPANGGSAVPVSVPMQTPTRPTSQPIAPQVARVPSNGPQRSPSVTSPTGTVPAPSSSPVARPPSATMATHNTSNAPNATNNTSQNGVTNGQAVTLTMPNGGQSFQGSLKSPSEPGPSNLMATTSPTRPTAQTQVQSTQPTANAVPMLNFPGVNYPVHPNQFRQIQRLFGGDATAAKLLQQNFMHSQIQQQQRFNTTYPNVVNGGMNGTNINNLNMPPPVNVKLPAGVGRGMTWQRQQEMLAAQQMQQLNVAAQALNGHISPTRPSQSPSGNMMITQLPDSKSPTLQHLQHTQVTHLGSPSQPHLSPPRNMQTPIPNTSPLQQHQHIPNGTNHGQGF